MKKMIGRLIFIWIAAIFPTVLAYGASAAPVGYTAHTDIVTYVFCYWDWHPIESYNINDLIYVNVEDLENYQFYVNREGDNIIHLVLYEEDYGKPGSPYAYPQPQKNTQKTGTKHLPIYDSDIKVYFKNTLLPSFDINGKTVISIERLLQINDNDSQFNAETRTLHINFLKEPSPNNWGFVVKNPDYRDDLFEMKGPGAFEIKNDALNSEPNFILANASGNWGALDCIILSGNSLSFSSHTYIDFPYKDTLVKRSNFIDGKRRYDDTEERRKALRKIFRLYINGDSINGELSYKYDKNVGNGFEYSFQFYYDKNYRPDEIKTMRIEFSDGKLPSTE